MFVGETGVMRVVDRACQLMKEGDVKAQGGIDLPTIQRYLNLWFSVSEDLFGGEVSSNAADYFASGLKGRYREDSFTDHVAIEGVHDMEVIREGKVVREEIPIRNAMNELLRDAYTDDCRRGVDRWNKKIAEHGIDFTLKLPSRHFHRAIGQYASVHFDPGGKQLTNAEWEAQKEEYLPSAADRAYVGSLMKPVTEPGQIANWIAPPPKGINGQPFEFEYVRLA